MPSPPSTPSTPSSGKYASGVFDVGDFLEKSTTPASRTHRFRRYRGVVTSADILAAVQRGGFAADAGAARALGQELVDAGVIENVEGEVEFEARVPFFRVVGGGGA
eukprot:CAMPEP_0174898742 /NCGR_PEP_ID=MMETSP0167-20121228/23555_1 /TAXON_ID=38298 /ORGANISM="Rhodella maculata, Strain CCMP736" /LENGTH=105 /DNA_ID=CAMNT_0016139471 /DNA_START=99 /DNA_END=413 /DNA_ORIENTATION=+